MVSVRHVVFGVIAFGLLAVTAGAAIDVDRLLGSGNGREQQQPDRLVVAQQQPQTGAQPADPPKGPPPPSPVRTEILRFENWTVTCNEFAEGPKKRICSAQLHVTQQNSTNVLLAWTVGLDGDNRPVSVIQIPTGVSIAPGVEVRLGKAAVRKMPFVSCEPQRCTASIPVDNSLVRDITAAASADIVVYAPNGSGVKFNFALKGFDKAYAELAR